MTREYKIKSPRKLIEVALPLDTINDASAKEKAIRRGHPSTLHMWWARRPVVAARAIIFAQMVNDPGFQQGEGFKYGMNKKEAAKERKRLFDIIDELVLWKNTNNERVLEKARAEILRSWREVCELNKDHPCASELFNPDKLPGLHDPFAGGGAIPLEAQRLGLEAFASDLNPIPVLINKAMIEIPPTFSGQPPVHSGGSNDPTLIETGWAGTTGLAEDIRYYGKWILDEAARRLSQLYPQVEITSEMVNNRSDLRPYQGRKLTAIAWLWARTVKSPNPAFSHVNVPLVSSFMLSTGSGKEAYIEPVVEEDKYYFSVKIGKPRDAKLKSGTKLGRGANFSCVMSGAPLSANYIRTEAQAGRMGVRLMAIVAKGDRGRVYLPPNPHHEQVAKTEEPEWIPNIDLPVNSRYMTPTLYGMNKWSDLFTTRQLVTLKTLFDLTVEVRDIVHQDCLLKNMPDGHQLDHNGNGAIAYAEAISVYLAMSVSKMANRANTLATWMPGVQCPGHLFRRHALSMSWDYCEGNSIFGPSGSFESMLDTTVDSLRFVMSEAKKGSVSQINASTQSISATKIVSTDPPYYDNVPYADLSDFFYVWLRQPLRQVFPSLFATLVVPKAEELVATPDRHGGKEQAECFFLEGMTQAMKRLADNAHGSFPVTIYYAFKQSESNEGTETSSTGWETFLDAVIRAGFAISGTWPMRTERENRTRSQGSNALASSIILVCRQRAKTNISISRRDFIRELNQILPVALDEMTRGVEGEQSPVAPVDLSQAIIGPGMAVFSKYSAVLEADGEPMTVRTALQLINRFLAEDDFDRDTQFCLHWFEQNGWAEGVFGEADVLARAKATSVDGLDEAGVIESGGGKVRLLRWSEYPKDWDPVKDLRTPVWEALHHLIRGLKQGGESDAGKLLAGVQSQAEAARQLAYRLYTLCERKGWAEDARAYNELITSWSAIETAAPRQIQRELF